MCIARVCRKKYPNLDGAGAAEQGGRWNSVGIPIVYAASCGALAVLEYRVHSKEYPDDLVLLTIQIPDNLSIEQARWIGEQRTAQAYGDAWVKSKRSPVLAVPSVVVPKQVNYLLNPGHPDLAGSIKVEEQLPFMLDVRLFSDIYP